MSARIPTGELMDLGDLPRTWDILSEVYKRFLALGNVSPTALTSRAFDQAQTSGTRAYIAAHRYIVAAMDNHEALRAVLAHHGATPSAPWSLMRPTFEAAFLALWVLDPIDGAARRARGLKVEVLDEKERINHLRAFATVPAMAVEIEEMIAERRSNAGETYRQEAKELGLDWGKLCQRVNVVDELPNLAFVRAQSDPLVAAAVVGTWRLLSGYEHSLGYAMMRGSDTKVVGKIDGGQHVMVTINDNTFQVSAGTTAWLLLEALLRYERLHQRA